MAEAELRDAEQVPGITDGHSTRRDGLD
jgi:hypothetical protein